ncbi:unnamed protein product [Brassica rapa]|uniref:Bet v I/Major latex protein domain-containing protein n=1 Tax=Brassica campestris TaxID=3711 RepID=A0A3P6DDN5_BRACM|nr:unnamed protein product [Brassica rapa]VDD18702.1 unnamed protein product [Brassica rapa]
MARILETTVELKSSPGKFLDMFVGKQQFEISSVCPSYVQGCELREGEMGQVGSIVVWRYVHGKWGGKNDDGDDRLNRSGEQPDHVQVTSKEGDVGSVAHWHFQYVKLNEKVADPESLLQFAIEVSKEIDAHLFSW